MSFIIFVILFVVLAGWLDSRLNWPKPVIGRGRRERL
jgi:hypothetical protein